jgi:hypothetical protein
MLSMVQVKETRESRTMLLKLTKLESILAESQINFSLRLEPCFPAWSAGDHHVLRSLRLTTRRFTCLLARRLVSFALVLCLVYRSSRPTIHSFPLHGFFSFLQVQVPEG